MKEDKKTSKIKSAILSIIAAILVWVAITYTNPPRLTTTISNLPVRFAGEESLRERGLTVVGRSGITGLSVEIAGRKDNLLSLSGGIYVEVDVSTVTEAGKYELAGNVTLPDSSLTIESVRFDTVPVTVDKIAIKEIPVRVAQSGSSAAGLLIKTEPEDKTVILTGAKSEIDAVSYGEAMADISGIESDAVLEAGYMLMDENGSPISDNETISATKTRINIEYSVYNTVTLPVNAVLSDELAQNYVIEKGSVSVTPSTVEVGVRDETFPDSITALITDAENTNECTLIEDGKMYIPENTKTVRVRANISRRMSKTVTLDVAVKNLDPGLSAQTEQITVTAEGAEDKLDNITASVDLSGYTAGTYSVPVTIESGDAEISGSYSINVTIS